MSKTFTNTCGTRKSGRVFDMLVLAAMFVPFLTVASAPEVYAKKKALDSSLLQNMDFGEFMATASSGTVILSPTGSATYSGVLATGGAVLSAEFEVRGTRFETFLITLPSQVVIAGASGDMIIDSFTSNPVNSGVLNGQGRASVTVGATMHMTDLMSSDLYSSSFDITFTYEVYP